MKRIKSTIILIVIFSLILNVNALQVGNSSEEESLELEIQREMELQNNAVAANINIKNAWFDGKDIKHPEYYAGAYIEGEYLYIMLTDSDEDIQQEIKDLAGVYSEFVRFERADYSWNQMECIVEQLNKELRSNITTTFSCGIQTKENKIELCIEPEYAYKVTEIMFRVVPAEICVVNYQKKEQIESRIQIEANKTNTSSRSTAIYGGTEIASTYNGNTYTETLGYMGTYGIESSAVKAYVTCGHALTVGGTVKQVEQNSSIGTTSYVRYSDGSYGDFAIITANNNYSLTNKVLLDGSTVSIYAVDLEPAENTYVYVSGKEALKSGKSAYCRIKNTSESYTSYSEYLQSWVTINGLMSVTPEKRNNAIVYLKNGDSGAPVFRKAAGNTDAYIICGIFCAKGDTEDAFFTPWSRIASAAFTAKTLS